MSHVKPLLFLTSRTIFNGLKRALTTPRRLISVVLVVAYYFLIFVRPAMGRSVSQGPELPPGTRTFDFPPLAVIDGVSFGLFAVLSLLMLGGVMSANSNFKPADVDVLFSTPLSPRLVLTFRILRDYLLTLFVPLLIAIFGLRPVRMGWEAIFRDMPNPEYSGLALRFMIISWLLMSLTWVVLSHAVTLYVNRTDRHADRRRRIFAFALGGFAIAVVGYVGWRVSGVASASDALAITHTPMLRMIFIPATFATQMTMAPFTPQGPINALMGAGGLVAMIGLCYWLALRQAGYLYDTSAIRVAQTSKTLELQKSGDVSGMLAQRAQMGKFRGLRLRFVGGLTMRGPWALVWKELLLQPRTMMSFLVLFVLVSVMFSLMPALMPSRRGEIGWVLIATQAMTVFLITNALAQTGFLEVLRRVDLQKPMPFRPWVTVTAEVFSKAVLGIFACIVGGAVAVALKPALWPFGLASVVAMPGYSVLLSACTFLVIMLFPDMEDSSQRGLRGLMIMLSIVIASLFPAMSFIGIVALGAPPYLGGAVAGLLALGIAIVLNVLSGRLYESFNPAE